MAAAAADPRVPAVAVVAGRRRPIRRLSPSAPRPLRCPRRLRAPRLAGRLFVVGRLGAHATARAAQASAKTQRRRELPRSWLGSSWPGGASSPARHQQGLYARAAGERQAETEPGSQRLPDCCRGARGTRRRRASRERATTSPRLGVASASGRAEQLLGDRADHALVHAPAARRRRRSPASRASPRATRSRNCARGSPPGILEAGLARLPVPVERPDRRPRSRSSVRPSQRPKSISRNSGTSWIGAPPATICARSARSGAGGSRPPGRRPPFAATRGARASARGPSSESARSALPCRRSRELPTVSPWRIITMRRSPDMRLPGRFARAASIASRETLRQSAR